MNPLDHIPAPTATATPPTATRGNVIVRPVGGGRGQGGVGERSRTAGRKRQQADIEVDADVFGDEMIRHLVDDLVVPAIVEQIVREVSVGVRKNIR